MGLLFHIYPIRISVQNARAAWSDLGFFALDCYPKSKALSNVSQSSRGSSLRALKKPLAFFRDEMMLYGILA
jgi:hypothetical protein